MLVSRVNSETAQEGVFEYDLGVTDGNGYRLGIRMYLFREYYREDPEGCFNYPAGWRWAMRPYLTRDSASDGSGRNPMRFASEEARAAGVMTYLRNVRATQATRRAHGTYEHAPWATVRPRPYHAWELESHKRLRES